MKYTVEKVIDGIARYIDNNIYTNMTDIQELVARLVVGRAIQNSEAFSDLLKSNGFIRTFGFVDSDGMVNVDLLAQDIKREIARKGALEISIPMYGKLKFVPEDVDVIRRCIMEA
jgi:hypothetical protein